MGTLHVAGAAEVGTILEFQEGPTLCCLVRRRLNYATNGPPHPRSKAGGPEPRALFVLLTRGPHQLCMCGLLSRYRTFHVDVRTLLFPVRFRQAYGSHVELLCEKVNPWNDKYYIIIIIIISWQ